MFKSTPNLAGPHGPFAPSCLGGGKPYHR